MIDGYDEIVDALDWLGYSNEAHPSDCEICDDGSVYYGLTQILPPGTIEPDMRDEPQHGDFTITPSGPLGGLSALGRVEMGYVGQYKCDDDAVCEARRIMAVEQWWPNIWIVSDHGNWHLYSDCEG